MALLAQPGDQEVPAGVWGRGDADGRVLLVAGDGVHVGSAVQQVFRGAALAAAAGPP